MRKPLVAGNWKMYGSEAKITALLEAIIKGTLLDRQIDIALFPAFIHLGLARSLLANTSLFWGAQDIYPGTEGAFTGEVSGPMLAEYGCEFVLIGHSERRHIMKENLTTVADKFAAAKTAGLTPILCVGETQAEREQNQTESVLRTQIESIIEQVGNDAFAGAIVAYEPVWAIGTGLTATPAQAESAHIFIRELISQNMVDLGPKIRILYGGSVKPENASALFQQPNIDGALVGGASLNAAQFLAICQAAEQKINAII